MNSRNPILKIASVIGGLIAFGTVGYYLLFQGRERLMDCLYMTVISLTTVGYGEILEVRSVPGGRIFTMILITFGMGILIYSLSSLTAFIVEGQFTGLIRRRRMMKQIERLEGHTVVCGGGDTGYYVVEELLKCGRDVVLVDLDPKNLQRCQTLGEVWTLEGDAADDRTLRSAGIERAAGLVAALASDRENLFLVMSAQMLNPSLRIVAKAHDGALEAKMRRAGASAVVSPNYIGGMRIASEVIRPHAVEFLDGMLRQGSGTYRVSEVEVGKGGGMEGRTLRELNLSTKRGIQVLALREAGAPGFLYNPPADTRLTAGQVLVVLGELDHIAGLNGKGQGST